MIYGLPVTAIIAMFVAGVALALVDRYNYEINEILDALRYWLIYRESFRIARRMAKIDREIAEILNNPLLPWPLKSHTVINYISSIEYE